MSYKFGTQSKSILATCHPLLQLIAEAALKHIDLKVICGHRSNEEQQKAYDAGKSKVKPGQSLHNHQPSMAVDIVPYPVNWNDYRRFYYMGGLILAVAAPILEGTGFVLRWGGDWDRDGETADQSFNDLVHFELRKES